MFKLDCNKRVISGGLSGMTSYGLYSANNNGTGASSTASSASSTSPAAAGVVGVGSVSGGHSAAPTHTHTHSPGSFAMAMAAHLSNPTPRLLDLSGPLRYSGMAGAAGLGAGGGGHHGGGLRPYDLAQQMLHQQGAVSKLLGKS